jgi:ferredoxin-type protein NapH
MMSEDISLAITDGSGESRIQKIGILLFAAGILSALIAAFGGGKEHPILFFSLSFGAVISGGLVYAYTYFQNINDIKNNGIFHNGMTNRGAIAWLTGIVFTGFYIILYWFPQYLEGLIRMMDPFSWLLRSKPADQWFLYGSVYTTAVLVMGIRFIGKYRHSRYQILRTCSVMFFQAGFAFVIPGILLKLNQPEFYFSYFWPLKYSYLWPNDVHYLIQSGNIGYFMVFWGAIMTFIATPLLTYKYGKRWYCSFVCGCGGLAETMGDPYRQNSDKSLKAWKIERYLVYSILVFVSFTTILLWVNSAKGGSVLGNLSNGFSKSYGFFIGSIFSGVIGTGFYPIFGSRVWCRFGCPMAALLGNLSSGLPQTAVSAYHVAIALPIAKWELMFALMHKKEKI